MYVVLADCCLVPFKIFLGLDVVMKYVGMNLKTLDTYGTLRVRYIR